MARETASNTAPTIPGSAAGMTTWMIVSERVAPRASAPSRSAWGTAFMTSSESDETNGIIMMPMTNPAARALSDATFSPTMLPVSRKNGAIVRAAKKP